MKNKKVESILKANHHVLQETESCQKLILAQNKKWGTHSENKDYQLGLSCVELILKQRIRLVGGFSSTESCALEYCKSTTLIKNNVLNKFIFS